MHLRIPLYHTVEVLASRYQLRIHQWLRVTYLLWKYISPTMHSTVQQPCVICDVLLDNAGVHHPCWNVQDSITQLFGDSGLPLLIRPPTCQVWDDARARVHCLPPVATLRSWIRRMGFLSVQIHYYPSILLGICLLHPHLVSMRMCVRHRSWLARCSITTSWVCFSDRIRCVLPSSSTSWNHYQYHVWTCSTSHMHGSYQCEPIR